MTIVDLTGMAITEIRDFPAVSAIVGQKVRPELGQNEGPPAVVIESLTIDYNPFGRTRGAGLQAPLFAAKCFGMTRPQASQLANAVVEAVELRRARTDASGRLVFISLVEGAGDVVLDPVTKWPTATVTFSFVGAQHAVAV
jgi:hypothetical protein